MAFNTSRPTSQKFGRYFILKAETFGGTVTEIRYPFTCEFNVSRNNLASVNNATFTIYNLEESTRNSLFKDPFDIDTFRLIEFYAGYMNDSGFSAANPLFAKNSIIPLIFKGSIKQCYSERNGADFKTVIECFDGQTAMTSGFVSKTTEKGQTVSEIAADITKELPNLTSAVITTTKDAQSKRGVVQFGNPAVLLKELTDADFYIDRQVAYVIDESDVFVGPVTVIDSESGILEVPKKTQTAVTISILFEPRILVSQIIRIDSSVGKIYNGEYKVTGITHQGVVSGAVGGDYRTTLSLLSLGGTVPIYRVIQDNNTFQGARVVIGGAV